MFRTFLYTVIVTLGLTSQSLAQHYVGARVGLNMSTLATDIDVPGKSFKPGFGAGLLWMKTLKNEVAVQAELNYTQKGFNATDIKLSTAYLELPVMAKVFFGFPGQDRTKFRGFVNAGPYLGYWLSNKVTYKDALGNTVTSTEFSNSLNKLEFGLLLGGGIVYSMGPGYLTAEARYTFGLTNTDNNVDLSRNRVWGLYLSYYMPLQFVLGKEHKTENMKSE